MKPSIFYYVLFLIFTITTQSIFNFTTTNAASAAEVVVKDSTGKKVLNDVRYHIAPVAKGGSFKLTDTIKNKKVCPFDVVHDPKDNLGGEFMFTMTYKRETYLKTSRALAIDSGVLKNNSCEKSTFWTINDYEAKAPDNLITTGGKFESEETCFKVLEYPKPTNAKVHSYMLQHCPSSCGDGPVISCFNISITSYKGVNRLSIVGGAPFEFVFHKIAK
uniref:kunitz trypsin inhibitor 5-like n=1 Tax=Erigeron canadensis TaxID=72917 RepID=UPI001CB9AA8D|nr:kunitz trypsin inhibitor 5-like [Erigeron canadensis]